MSAKNEQYEIVGCELEFLNGSYSYYSKLEAHVHQTGKFHLFRTNKDYIWMITDSTRRKQYCFAQKIAPFPTMCNWNVFTGGDGVKGELLASNMRAQISTEPITVSPPKRSTTNNGSGKFSPFSTCQMSSKLDSSKKTSTKAESPSPAIAKNKSVAPSLKKVSTGALPVPTKASTASTKPLAPATATQARQVIASAAANILHANKGASVVRRSESFKNNPTVQETETNSLDVSPVVSATASPLTLPANQGLEIHAVMLLVPSLEVSFLQVIAPSRVTASLFDRETVSEPPLFDLSAIVTAWADTTVQLDREVERSHQRVHQLEQELVSVRQSLEVLHATLAQRTAELDTTRESLEKSQGQAQAAQEALREAVAQAKLIQDEIAQEREGAAQARARHAEEEAAAAQVRAQAALEAAKSVQTQATEMRAELDASEARAHAMRQEADKNEEQLTAALDRAHLAETLERDAQQQLQVARSQVQELQVALDLASFASGPVQIPDFEVSNLAEQASQLRIQELESQVQELKDALEKASVSETHETHETQESESFAEPVGAAVNLAADVTESQDTETAVDVNNPAPTVSEEHTQPEPSNDQSEEGAPRAVTQQITQQDVRHFFESELAEFETFACDAVTCLEDLGHLDDAAEVLVSEILAPMFILCHQYVQERLDRADGEGTESTGRAGDAAEKLLLQMEAVDTTALLALVGSIGPVVTDLHSSMVTAGTAGLIENSPSALRIPSLARVLLRCFALSAQSGPKCYLSPAPGRRVPYKKDFTVEILGLGTNKHGKLKKGEEVEVVLCGLYFDQPDDADFVVVKPVIPALVRRLPQSKK